MRKIHLIVLLCACSVSSATYAQEKKRYAAGKSSNLLTTFRQQMNSAHLPNGNSRLQLKTTASLTYSASVNLRQTTANGGEQLVGSIENVPHSSFFLSVENNNVHGHIIFADTKKAYQYSSDAAGAVYVEETDINQVVCTNYEKANESAVAASAPATTSVNAVAAVTDLQSYPGGNGCVLLDFDGQYVSGTPWNNGNPITAAPANLTDAEKQLIWELVSEDYRPFHLNITTSEAVFNTYAKTKRMRCIFTPTNTAAPGAGGVAYLGSFNWNDETPCWVFNGGVKGAGDAAAHEVGHTFGLSHDGRTSPVEEYYAGQGNWAPIMGVGYYVPVVQWSKGEYANSSQKEDDLAKISSTTWGVGYRADDFGGTTATAAALTVSSAGAVSQVGNIERTADVDMFSFTTTGGTVSLNFAPATNHPNLDILATIYNSAGTAVTSANPTALNASISTTLAAGTYYVAVTGTGYLNASTTGYSNYGSLGYYNITGTIAGGSNNPTGIAIFYKDCNYTGAYAVGLPVGTYTTAQLVAKGISNKDVSSIKVTSGYEVVLYKGDNFSGASAGFTADVACLVSNGWNDSASSVRIRSVSNTLPTVSISSPTTGTSYNTGASIAITAAASDADGAIAKVEFYNGSTKLGEDATSPYNYTWSNVGVGAYTIKAVATDDRGGQSTAQISVTVSSAAAATVYKDCNYAGYAVNLPVGTYTLNQLIAKGVVNDDISSLKVNSGYEAVLYKDDNFSGAAYVFRGNFACLVSVALSTGSTVNLNDWTSSITIRQSTAAAQASLSTNGSVASPVITNNTGTLIVAPNPAVDRVILQYGDAGSSFDVKITDISGGAVYKSLRAVSGQSVDVSSLKKGFYLITITNGKETVTKKLLKQ